MLECCKCGFSEDGMCTCSSLDKWYACPIENKKPENIKFLEDWIKDIEDKERSSKNGNI